jgi:predicted acyl esterase
VSGIGLRDEWAWDEWKEAAAAKSLFGVSALVGGGWLDQGRMGAFTNRYRTRPDSGLKGCRRCCPSDQVGGEEN